MFRSLVTAGEAKNKNASRHGAMEGPRCYACPEECSGPQVLKLIRQRMVDAYRHLPSAPMLVPAPGGVITPIATPNLHVGHRSHQTAEALRWLRRYLKEHPDLVHDLTLYAKTQARLTDYSLGEVLRARHVSRTKFERSVTRACKLIAEGLIRDGATVCGRLAEEDGAASAVA